MQRLFAGARMRPTKQSRHFNPEPRIAVGRWLRRRGMATAMIDVSDGLSVDLSRICDESRVAAVINEEHISNCSPGFSYTGAADGGEDYELLFTASPRSKVPEAIEGVRVTEIGTIRTSSDNRPQMQILGQNGALKPIKPLGWQHFNDGKHG